MDAALKSGLGTELFGKRNGILKHFFPFYDLIGSIIIGRFMASGVQSGKTFRSKENALFNLTLPLNKVSKKLISLEADSHVKTPLLRRCAILGFAVKQTLVNRRKNNVLWYINPKSDVVTNAEIDFHNDEANTLQGSPILEQYFQ